MRQVPALTRSAASHGSQTKIAIHDQDGMMRGLMHGMILSLGVWLTAGYVTFILR